MTTVLILAVVLSLLAAVHASVRAHEFAQELEHSHALLGDLVPRHADLRTRLRLVRALLWDEIVDLHPYRLEVHATTQPTAFRLRARSYTWALGFAPLLAEWGGPHSTVALYRDGPEQPVLLATFTHDADGHVQWHSPSSPDSAGSSAPASVTCRPSGPTSSPARTPSVASPTCAI